MMANSFEKRSLINGGALSFYLDRSVSLFLRVESLSSYAMKGVAPDGRTVEVNLPFPVDVASGQWVEVIGVPKNSNSMTAKEVIMLGGEKDAELDKSAYEMAARFLQNCKDIYN